MLIFSIKYKGLLLKEAVRALDQCVQYFMLLSNP